MIPYRYIVIVCFLGGVLFARDYYPTCAFHVKDSL